VVVVVPPFAPGALLEVAAGSSVVLDDVDELDVELLLDEVDDVPSARTSCPSSPSPPASASAAVRTPTTAIAATRPAIARPRPVSEVHQVPIGPP
jgi:hypothetical protein